MTPKRAALGLVAALLAAALPLIAGCLLRPERPGPNPSEAVAFSLIEFASFRFRSPQGLVADAQGTVYLADTTGYRIWRISASGAVEAFVGSGEAGSADGSGSSASLGGPVGLALDSAGNLYVADTLNHAIRRVDTSGAVTTLAGLAGTPGDVAGTGTAARFRGPSDIALDSANNLYVADRDNHRIKRVTQAGVVTVYAGSGTAGRTDGALAAASFTFPRGITVNSSGVIFVADSDNHRIRRVDPTSSMVSTLAGTGDVGSANGAGTQSSFNFPFDVAAQSGGVLYVADTNNSSIRRIDASGNVASAVPAAAVQHFNRPHGVTAYLNDSVLVADTLNRVIKQVSSAGAVSVFAQ